MATVIKIKRSETPSQVPGASALQPGEIVKALVNDWGDHTRITEA